MYFVYDGDVLVWYTGDKKEMDLEELPIPAMHYEYDDEKRWPDKKLEEEAALVSEDSEEYDEDISAVIEVEQRRRAGMLMVPEFDNWEAMIGYLDDYAADAFGDGGRRPLVFVDDVPLPIRKMVKDLARVERDELAARKENAGKYPDVASMLMNMDEFSSRRSAKLQEEGQYLRQKIVESELGEAVLDGYDYVEDMKDMAAQLFFLYAQERIMAESEGREPDEDYFYAANNLLTHAMIAQIADDDEDEEEYDPDLDDGTGEELDSVWEAFGDAPDDAAGGSFDDDMDQATEFFLKEKGFDISTLAGAKAAQKFLEEAGPEDAFLTEGLVDHEMDSFMGRMRLQAMLRCVHARIRKMIREK